MKNNECFHCLNSKEDGVLAENTGWYHECKLGIQNEGLKDVSQCPKYEMNTGFQLGGYYTHMHFEKESPGSDCLKWVIHGDGEFPLKEEEKSDWLMLHLCEFEQLEHFVEVWGKELRKRGCITDYEEG